VWNSRLYRLSRSPSGPPQLPGAGQTSSGECRLITWAGRRSRAAWIETPSGAILGNSFSTTVLGATPSPRFWPATVPTVLLTDERQLTKEEKQIIRPPTLSPDSVPMESAECPRLRRDSVFRPSSAIQHATAHRGEYSVGSSQKPQNLVC
jgi:hypothetical protein